MQPWKVLVTGHEDGLVCVREQSRQRFSLAATGYVCECVCSLIRANAQTDRERADILIVLRSC
jgi:hypothetical protein